MNSQKTGCLSAIALVKSYKYFGNRQQNYSAFNRREKMKDNQHEQQLTEAPLFEEISDDNSASITGGARADFSGIVPRIGEVTFPRAYTTTSQFNDITIRMSENPYELKVIAVRANGSGDVGKWKTIPANYRGPITVASNVRDNTAFKLKFDAPTLNWFDIAGVMTY
jgi:hypothetical protein